MKLHQSYDKIIVTELRPMSEARSLGISICLAVLVYRPDCFCIVEQFTDKYWSDGVDCWLEDDEFIGWIKMPICKPGIKVQD